jgi:hypothetical protein
VAKQQPAAASVVSAASLPAALVRTCLFRRQKSFTDVLHAKYGDTRTSRG